MMNAKDTKEEKASGSLMLETHSRDSSAQTTAHDSHALQFDERGLPTDPQHLAAFKRGLRKLDRRSVPPLTILWLANFIDRSNIGNARQAGLFRDLRLTDNKYSTALALFYVTYIFSELPSNMMLRKLGAKFWLPFLVFCWGIITICLGFVQNFAGLVVVRMLLGLFEGGLLPGMPLYLSTLYPRYMVQFRIGLFYASASLAGAFGGVLATGFIQMDGLGAQTRTLASRTPVTATGVAGWRWIFIMEGLLTVIIACFSWWCLPASVKEAKFIPDDEREALLAVLGRDMQNNRAKAAGVAPAQFTPDAVEVQTGMPPVAPPTAVTTEKHEAGTAKHQAMVFEEEQFEWREIRRGLVEPQAWFTGIAYLLICNSLYSFSLFLPTILRGIYPEITTTRLQLLTVPPYVPATIMVLIVAWMADRTRMRGPYILACLPICMIGYIMLLVSSDAKVQYGATFLIALGIYPVAPCILTIPINNTSGLYKRGTVNALQLMIANLAGFIATFIYQSKWAPRYVQGHSVALGSVVLAWIFVAINVWWCWSENRARAAGKRDGNWEEYERLLQDGKTRAPIGDRSPEFRYTL